MGVYLSVAPPDGFEDWSEPQWDDWLDDHPWEPAELLVDRGDWLIFLYQARVHASKVAGDLAPFLERLITEKPISSREVGDLREALKTLARAFGTVPASRLWTGTQFYTADELHKQILAAEERTGKAGAELTIFDLWDGLFPRIDAVLSRAIEQERGVYFGHV